MSYILMTKKFNGEFSQTTVVVIILYAFTNIFCSKPELWPTKMILQLYPRSIYVSIN